MEEEIETMTVEETAKKLHKGVENIRAGLRQGKYPFRHSSTRKNRTMELHNNKK